MAKVLMFHRILPEVQIQQPNSYFSFGTLISSEYFTQILQFIVDQGFEFCQVCELEKYQQDHNKVALTFDDGYFDNYEFAYPILMEYKATATFYPVAEPCAQGTVLPLDIYYQSVDNSNMTRKKRNDYVVGNTKKMFYWTNPGLQHQRLHELFEELPTSYNVSYLSEANIQELSREGFEIGSHGMNHSLLTADYMTEESIRFEMEASKEWLERTTGRKISSFCFPAGRYNNELLRLAKELGYSCTCLVYRNKYEILPDLLPSYERFFVEPDKFDNLKSYLLSK